MTDVHHRASTRGVSRSNIDVTEAGVVREPFATNLAPSPHWSEMGDSEHIVQFYETDDALIRTAGGYISTALRNGDAAIVIATAEHRAALDDGLRAAGMSVPELAATRRYISRDAAELLATFKSGTSLDAGVIAETLGAIITWASGDGRGVRIFGEMVALLSADGSYDAALELEQQWNELSKRYSFSLLCGYPMSVFADVTLTDHLRDVCASHSHVVPAESYSDLDDPRNRLQGIALLQQRASLLEAEIEMRKRTEEELRTSQTSLTRALQERDEFLRAIAHDLKTPVTVLVGQAQLLRRRSVRGALDDEGLSQGLQQIESRSRLLAEMVDELQDVTELRAGEGLRLDRRLVDLVAVVRDVVARLDPLTPTRRLAVRTDERELVGQWDGPRLRRVVENLVDNALKYDCEGSEITLSLYREHSGPADDWAVLTVRDTGIGITEIDLPHIFEPYYRTKEAANRIDGAGLGLAGTQQIVQQHSGTLSVTSEPGRGSLFTVRLPLGAST